MHQACRLVISEIEKQMDKGNRNASGEAVNSLRYEVKQQGGRIKGVIYGAEHWTRIEKGSAPGEDVPTVKQIYQWIEDKGLKPKNGNKVGFAIAIVKTIEAEGSPTKNSPAKSNLEIVAKSLDEAGTPVDKLADEYARALTENLIKEGLKA